jgi:hypothetical protein
MNPSESRLTVDESEDAVATAASRPQRRTREQTRPVMSASAPAMVHTKNGRTYVYTPGSLWSHLKYGLGTLAVLVFPPLIPGATVHGLIMGYGAALGVLLATFFVWGAVRNLHSRKGRR